MSYGNYDLSTRLMEYSVWEDGKAIVPANVLREWKDMARKLENDLVQIHTYTACRGCGTAIRWGRSVGPGLCSDCATDLILKHDPDAFPWLKDAYITKEEVSNK